MTHPPKDIGSAVPEGFVFPWNTTRTMADVWAEDNEYEQARSSGSRGGLATKAKRQAAGYGLGAEVRNFGGVRK